MKGEDRLLTDAGLLALHREITAIPSVSGGEEALASFLADQLAAAGAELVRVGNNLLASLGRGGPVLVLNSHLDTVPPAPGWTRSPFTPVVEGERVYGLGANDAKASVAAMTAAFVRLVARSPNPGVQLLLMLVSEEETGGKGTEVLVDELARRGLAPEAAVIGEPTGLDIVIAQKGLLVLELAAAGQAAHAAHARALAAPNAIRALARDLVRIDEVDLGPPHPLLGAVTVEPTMLGGGTARNMVPAEARCVLDLRTNPDPTAEEIVARLRRAVRGELRILSDRLRPAQVDREAAIVRAARLARPESALAGSRTLSDLVFFRGVPAIKAGPGRTERSHTADEFVLEGEIVAGARFYEALVLELAALAAAEETKGAALESR